MTDKEAYTEYLEHGGDRPYEYFLRYTCWDCKRYMDLDEPACGGNGSELRICFEFEKDTYKPIYGKEVK